MKVLFLTQFSAIGGSSRIYALQFLPLLSQRNIVCDARYFYSDKFFKIQMGLVRVGKFQKFSNFFFYIFWAIIKKFFYALLAGRYDIVFIQREVFPVSIYWLLRKFNPRIIYEIEDTIYEINPFLRRGSLHELALRYQANLCFNMMEKAAWVIAENEYLAAEARKHNQNVSIITFPIDTNRFIPGTAKADDAVTIGWIGSPSTTALLKTLEPVFMEITKKYHNVKLKTVGAALDFTVPAIPLIKKNWSLVDEVEDLRSFDIGLMPLDNSPFNRGRLGGKMIQYMSVAIPIVASDVGLNRTVIKDGFNGFLASDISNWVERLSRLIENRKLRRQLGKNGRKMAVKLFSLDQQVEILVRVLKTVGGISRASY